MKNRFRQFIGLTIMAGVILVGCSGGSNNGNSTKESSAQKESNGLTAFEKEHGIGPVTEEIKLPDSIEEELAEKGEEIFETKCSACHKMSERYVGPALGDVLDRRSPTYVMNMILNPDEMVKKHPEARKKLAEFMTPMPDQNLSREEARAVVEYLRSENVNGGDDDDSSETSK